MQYICELTIFTFKLFGLCFKVELSMPYSMKFKPYFWGKFSNCDLIFVLKSFFSVVVDFLNT